MKYLRSVSHTYPPDSITTALSGQRTLLPYKLFSRPRIQRPVMCVELDNFRKRRAQLTRRSQRQHLTPFEDPKRTSKPHPALVAPPSSDERNRPTGRDENTLVCKELVMWLLGEASRWKDSDCENPDNERRTSEHAPEGPVERVDALRIMGDAVNQLTDKSGARVARVTDEGFAGIMGATDTSRNKSFF